MGLTNKQIQDRIEEQSRERDRSKATLDKRVAMFGQEPNANNFTMLFNAMLDYQEHTNTVRATNETMYTLNILGDE